MAKNVTMKNMNVENVRNDLKRITKGEHMLGRSLLQPFCNTNSGSRKLMHSTHLEQRLALLHPEVPFVQTGYENEFGKHASSYLVANDEYVVLSKVQKFENVPNQHYFLIVQNTRTSELDIIEKVDYEYITETYGYLNNNSVLDRLEPIDPTSMSATDNNLIHKDEVYKKSMAFDEYGNRQDGVNLLTAYISTAKNTEDSVIISESAAKKLASPLIKPVTILVNENDILLNMYGNEYEYKSFPDIGEEINENLLAVVRREKKEESLYTHSYNRLTDFHMNDEKFMTSGKIIDIDVYCNNPETIDESPYNVQIKKYKNNKLRYLKEVLDSVKAVQDANDNSLPMSYELQKFLYKADSVLSGVQYINDKPYTGTVLKLTVLEENEIKVGDKVSNRFGGKGVVSFILPDNEMPMIESRSQPVEILFNSCTCVGRLNPGQMFETSISFISKKIIDFILLNVLDVDDSLNLVREFIRATGCKVDEYIDFLLNSDSPEAAKEEYISSLMKEEYVNSIVKDDGIMLSLEPISDSMTIDQLADIYRQFAWIKPYNMVMPVRNSNGQIRYVRGRRPMTIGTEYIYRLKQYGEDKFSATSLSATNIRNLNTRSKSNKQYKYPHTKTPVRMGDMEFGNLTHLGSEIIACVGMMYSSSPHGRRIVQNLYKGDPFDVNIKLDNKAKNRNIEIINARLKTCGYRLTFTKIPKKLKSPVKRLRRDVVVRPKCPVKRLRRDVVIRAPKKK